MAHAGPWVYTLTGATNPSTVVEIRTDIPPASPTAQAKKPTDLTWTSINPADTPLNDTFSIGESSKTIYFTAAQAGTVPLTAFCPNVLVSTVQYETITNGPIAFFTIEHPFTSLNPLSVQVGGAGTVQARDQFKNRVTGDSTNGNYYEGTALFWNFSTTTTANIVDMSVSSYTFTKTMPEPGRYSGLVITDKIYEYVLNGRMGLIVGATDQNKPAIYGFTNDPRSFGSSGYLITDGAVCYPDDFAPDPQDQTKIVSYHQPLRLYTGQGMIPSKPAPVAMIRMTLSVQPPGIPALSSATITHVTIQQLGTLPADKIAEVDIYKDNNPPSPDGIFRATLCWAITTQTASSAICSSGARPSRTASLIRTAS